MKTAKQALIERIQDLQSAGRTEYTTAELRAYPIWILEQICDRMLLEAGISW